MKKFISYFLIFALFLTSMPMHLIAQDIGTGEVMYVNNDPVKPYRPAMSFKYDSYEVGKISPYRFVEGLEADLLNGEDVWDPSSKPRLGDDKLGTPEHLAQSYNDFLYYNIYPEESPLWNKTALIPGNGVAEEDVMDILRYHYSLSQNISLLFRENPEYRNELTEKRVRLIPVSIILLATFYVSWEVAPEIVTGLIPYFSTTGKLAAVLKTITSFATMIAFDAFITDQIAWHLTQSSDRMKYLYQSVGSYTNSRINISLKTDLLKSVKETEYDRIKEDLQKISKTNKEYNRGDALILKRYFKKGYGKVDQMYRPHLRRILGKFLYDLFDGDEVLIDEYFRKEMLRTYYALEFIKDELANTNDPLRYERAGIDLATTYKIQTIQINDGRMIKRKDGTKVMTFGQNLQQIKGEYNLGKYENRDFLGYIDNEIERELGSQLADQTSVMTTYPTMLTRAEVNYLVQLMDIPKKKKAHDELVEKQRRKHAQTIKDIEKKISKRVNENLESSNWSMTK